MPSALMSNRSFPVSVWTTHFPTSSRTRESKEGSEKHSRVHQNVDGMALVFVLDTPLLLAFTVANIAEGSDLRPYRS